MTDVAGSSGAGPHNMDERLAVDGLQLFLAHWRGAMGALGAVLASVALNGADLRPDLPWMAWFALTGLNTTWQAFICWRMQRQSPHVAYRKWHRWLLTSIGFNGFLVGILPLAALDMSAGTLAVPVGLAFMMLFCVASSPGTIAMGAVGSVSLGLTVTSVLVFGQRWPVAGTFAVFATLMGYYGNRLQMVWRQGMLNQYAAERLARELQEQQSKVASLERERTLLMERQRLSRDMHDGIGSALVSSLSAVQRGDWSQEQVAEMLRDCLDDLRSVIFSLEPSEGDLTTLLAAMRPQLERRLAASDMLLRWEMGDLPPLAWLGPSEALHVMRVVQETVANAIKHSGAREVRLAAGRDREMVEITIRDDGKGFDPAQPLKFNGLQFARRRAALLKGAMDVRSSQDGTQVTLRLPVESTADGRQCPP